MIDLDDDQMMLLCAAPLIKNIIEEYSLVSGGKNVSLQCMLRTDISQQDEQLEYVISPSLRPSQAVKLTCEGIPNDC